MWSKYGKKKLYRTGKPGKFLHFIYSTIFFQCVVFCYVIGPYQWFCHPFFIRRSKNSKKVGDLWWNGVPPSVRGVVWSLAIGNDLHMTPGKELTSCFKLSWHKSLGKRLKNNMWLWVKHQNDFSWVMTTTFSIKQYALPTTTTMPSKKPGRHRWANHEAD